MPVAAIGGSLIGAAIAGHGASKAAQAQAAAAQQAADYEKQNSAQALDYQKNMFGQTQQNFQPYVDAGANGLSALQNGLGVGGNAQGTGLASGSLLTPYQSFQAPTGLDYTNDPGYQARLKLGTDALQRSAAARGGVLTGGTARDLNSYAQDYASNEYGNVYNRALQSYGTNAQNYYTGQGNAYNRLAALAGAGQNAVGTLGQLGQQSSNNVTGNLLQTGQEVAGQYNNAGAAKASGYAAQGNIWGNAIGGAGNTINQYSQLQQLMGSGYGGGYGGGNPAPGSMSYLLGPAAGVQYGGAMKVGG